jgi:transcriptional regulator with XRE-family HTH domain
VVATVRAHGYVVQVRRGHGPHLLLEASMSGRGRKRPQKYVADAKTADVVVGTTRAKAFAAGLAAETSGSDRLPLHIPAYEELTAEIGRRGVDVPNLRTVQNRWQEVFALDDGETVGPELREELEERVVDFRDALFARGMDRKTVNSYVTRARKLAAIAGSMVRSEADGLTFGEALKQALLARNMTSAEAAAAVGVKPGSMWTWVAGKNGPGRKYRYVVPALERLFALPDRWLASRLAPFLQADRNKPSRFGMVLEELALAKGWSLRRLAAVVGINGSTLREWVRGASPSLETRRNAIPRLEEVLGVTAGHLAVALPPLQLNQLPYRAKFNAAQEREWAALVVHKTDRHQSDRSLRPNTFWRVVNGKLQDGGLHPGGGVCFQRVLGTLTGVR